MEEAFIRLVWHKISMSRILLRVVIKFINFNSATDPPILHTYARMS